MDRLRSSLIWLVLLATMCVPVVFAAFSPYLAWRDPVYIIAGLAGIIAMTLMLAQPLLASGVLPGLPSMKGRRFHQRIGFALVLLVISHVAGLWITSPPDVIDALLFRSPTPFSVWGVLAMWLVFAVALMSLLRWRLGMRPSLWRQVHKVLVVLIVAGTIVHAWLIQGTMEVFSKAILSGLVIAVLLWTIGRLQKRTA